MFSQKKLNQSSPDHQQQGISLEDLAVSMGNLTVSTENLLLDKSSDNKQLRKSYSAHVCFINPAINDNNYL